MILCVCGHSLEEHAAGGQCLADFCLCPRYEPSGEMNDEPENVEVETFDSRPLYAEAAAAAMFAPEDYEPSDDGWPLVEIE